MPTPRGTSANTPLAKLSPKQFRLLLIAQREAAISAALIGFSAKMMELSIAFPGAAAEIARQSQMLSSQSTWAVHAQSIDSLLDTQ